MISLDRLPTSIVAMSALLLGAIGCTGSEPRAEVDTDYTPEKSEVIVDASLVGATVAPYAFGIHTSVYDNALHAEYLPSRLEEAGIDLLRYPGGGYSDNYHWSTHTLTPFANGSKGWLAAKSDFGSYVGILDRTGTTAMITVNYGSNLDGTGPGEPKEAAAWVAYANGSPNNATEIGNDSIGNDWKTVGFWATLRASSPLPVDDGFNFLRIAHPEALGIEYWEVGNEVFGNGYYQADGTNGYELDLHVPYDAENAGKRYGRDELSPTTYGKNWLRFAAAMRAVDPSIRVGAVLNTPPKDYQWGPNWNEDVLAQCGHSVDFVVVHYYPNGSASALLEAPRLDVPRIFSELRKSFAAHAGANASNIEVAVTELGPNADGTTNPDPLATGIFATEAYVTFMEYGAVNLDWLELHKVNGNFLDERTGATGPAFNGIRVAHEFAKPGDRFVKAKSTILGLTAHAVVRPDGSVSLLLVNSGLTTRVGVPVRISGVVLASEGARVDYRREGSATNVDGAVVGPAPMSGIGNEFSIDLQPRTVTVLSIPPKGTP